MSDHWSSEEVNLIITDYFSMLSDELVGNPINKTFHRNALKSLLRNRSDGSIEFKHQNISAVLIKLGLPYIKGYKPKWNYQQILEENIISFIAHHKSTLELKFIQFSEITSVHFENIDFNLIIEAPPEKQFVFSEPENQYQKKPIKINYLEREQNNISLGTKGEELIMAYEKWRLITLGKESLGDAIEWISKSDDGAGFDILSKNENGTDRYIEVKTTKLSKDSPIFFSKNEYEFSKYKSNDYYLYRVFNFDQTPKMFNLKGNFDDFCFKEAIQYKGHF
ncbi:MAG: hypothetical protein JWN78_375 [Bacteroidota bacterium]|nr:hypothetical protein [Bacteroidota bacterium]